MAKLSATSVHASITPTTIGTYQLRGARSSTSHVASNGTWVPTWSGWKTRMNTPGPNCGATMIPAVISMRTKPSQPVARPLASSPATRTSSV